MKKFNIEEALQGKPVRLRGGLKAIIYYRIPDEYTYSSGNTDNYPLLGIIFDKDGNIKHAHQSWKLCGANHPKESDYDIIGMYEDKITAIIQKAYKENLPLRTRSNKKVHIVAIIPFDSLDEYAVFGYTDHIDCIRWTMKGKYISNDTASKDIVGFWEE